MGSPLDLTGERFGHLVVCSRIQTQMRIHRYVNLWLCKCDCGSFVVAQTRTLTMGALTTCEKVSCRYCAEADLAKSEKARAAMAKHRAAQKAWYERTQAEDPEKVDLSSGTPKATRRCHDCHKPCTDYRCSACLAKWRAKHNVRVGRRKPMGMTEEFGK